MYKLVRASVVLLAASGLATASLSAQDRAGGIGRPSAERAEANRQAAEQGDADAQYNLGLMYRNGLGVIQDFAEAVRWYRLAAEQGNAHAQILLGLSYESGDGVIQDEAEAVRWYRLAAEQGDASAQYHLGFRYEFGEGVIKDEVLAHMWFNIAGANGIEFAREERDRVEGKLTRAEISRATELARACVASDYQDCAL